MKKLTYNAPTILTFSIVSLAVLVLNILTNGYVNQMLFMVYRTSLTDPLQYIRLFTHILGHADFSHYVGNFMMILLIGPMVEERYGSKPLALMILITAFITGIIHVMIFPGQALLGASGIAFMLIVMGSATNFKKGELPLTLIIVTVLFLGQEVLSGVSSADNISQLTHILGGICGCFFAFAKRG